MSGIVGSLNTRGSGLINIGSAADGNIFTGTGAGLPAGFEAAAGGGKIGAVVSMTPLTSIVATTANAAWVDITGLTITTGSLASTDSKVLLFCNVSIQNGTQYAHARVVDGSGNYVTGFVGDARSSRARTTSSGNVYHDGDNLLGHQQSWLLLDSPASTSAQTYKIQAWSADAAVVYTNQGTTDTDSVVGFTAVSTMHTFEIL